MLAHRCVFGFFVVLTGALAAAAAPLPKPAGPREGPLGMKFVPLPKGTFYMGWNGDKKGVKTEIKEDFEIATTTVTQGQWQELMGKNPSWFSRDGEGQDATLLVGLIVVPLVVAIIQIVSAWLMTTLSRKEPGER